MRVGDLVRYVPTHEVDLVHKIYGNSILGVIICGGTGDITKIVTLCGKIYWAVTKDCEVVSEGRRHCYR